MGETLLKSKLCKLGPVLIIYSDSMFLICRMKNYFYAPCTQQLSFYLYLYFIFLYLNLYCVLEYNLFIRLCQFQVYSKVIQLCISVCICVCVCVCVSLSVASNFLRPHRLQPARLLCSWNSPGKNTGGSSHSILQGIFQTQGSNPGLLYYRQILYHLSLQGNLVIHICIPILFQILFPYRL